MVFIINSYCNVIGGVIDVLMGFVGFVVYFVYFNMYLVQVNNYIRCLLLLKGIELNCKLVIQLFFKGDFIFIFNYGVVLVNYIVKYENKFFIF